MVRPGPAIATVFDGGVLRNPSGSGIFFGMSTVELILRKASALPPELQKEALHYVDYLAGKVEGKEDQEWARFSAEQLSAQYSEKDAVYDQD